MATKIIDGALSAAAFPANYTGPGTLIGNVVSSSGSVNQHTTGNFTSTNDDVEIRIGFSPRDVEIVNETDTIFWKKLGSMAAANALKITGVPAVTVDTGSLITIDKTTDGYRVLLKAALVGNAKAIHFSLKD